MKPNLASLLCAAAVLVLPLGVVAADKKTETAKAYPLDKCIVTGEKLGADPDMKPHTFTVDGQEVKLCCKSCLKDFNKNKAKYMSKIEEAQKKK